MPGESNSATTRKITWAELAKHNTQNDNWIAINGEVFDVTAFANIHPGGVDNLLLAAGRECTSLFVSYHPLYVWNTYKQRLAAHRVGELVDDASADVRPHNVQITPFYLELKKKVEAFFKQTKRDPRRSFDMETRVPLIIAGILLFHFLTLHVVENWALAIVTTLLHGLFSALLCLTGVHEASHSAMTHTPSMWKLVGTLSHNFLNGANFLVWQNQHIVGHHLLTNVHEADPDIAGDLFRFSPNQKWLSHHAWQFIVAPIAYGLLSFRTRVRDILLFASPDASAMFGSLGFNFGRRPLETTLLATSKLFFVFYRYLLPLYCGIGLMRLVLLTVISDMFGSMYLAFLFQCNHVVRDAQFPVADSKGQIDMDWGKMQIATTQDYGHDSYLTYWMTGALNYQVTHHLFPYVSQAHYRELAPVIKQYCKENNVNYIARKDVFEAARAHLGMLYDLAHDPTKKAKQS